MGIISGIGTALGMKLLGGGGDDGDDGPRPLEPPWQTELRKQLAMKGKPKALQRIGRAGEAYPGQLPGTAGMSEYEAMGLETLGDYLRSPLPTEGKLYGMGKEELEKTLGGEEYDPLQGAYWQAYRTQMERAIEEAKDRIASRTSARDKFFGGGRIAAEGEVEEEALTNLQMVLGSLVERERERRLGAVGETRAMGAFEEMIPTARAGAGLELGALPRILEESELGAEYGEYIRQLSDLGIPLDVALGMSTYKPDYYYPYDVSPTEGFGGIAQALAQIAAGGKKGVA